MQRFVAILKARNYEFFRDRAALGWNVLLPVFIVMGFAYAFAEDGFDRYQVGIYGSPREDSTSDFFDLKYIRFVSVSDLRKAIIKIERHQLDILFDVTTGRYWINDNSPRGYILERVFKGVEGTNFSKKTVSGEEIRYVDWLIPGVLGMNMMFSALFGVGYVIVRYRRIGVLKRLQATPLTAFEFLAAQVISRLWLIIVITALVYFSTDVVVDFKMYGSYFTLLLLFALGAVSLISLGLIVAARISSEELANGLLNLVSWPMIFLSGVWFSLEGLHPYVQKLAFIFPLTHVTEAAREIMIDGANLIAVSDHLGALILMSMIFLIIGSHSFRWE